MPKDYTEKLAQLKQVAVTHRNGPSGVDAQLEIEAIYREMSEEAASERLNAMNTRLDDLGQSVKALNRKEWKTWTFWIVVVTLLVASAALLRDVVDWTIFGFDSPAPKHQSQVLPPIEPQGQQSSTVEPRPSQAHQSADPPP